MLEKRIKVFDVYVWGIACLGIFLLAANIPVFDSSRQAAEVFFLLFLCTLENLLQSPFLREKAQHLLLPRLYLPCLCYMGLP